jgi:hypothetical protein
MSEKKEFESYMNEIVCLLSVTRTALNGLIDDLKDESASLTVDDILATVEFAKVGIDFALKSAKEDTSHI